MDISNRYDREGASIGLLPVMRSTEPRDEDPKPRDRKKYDPQKLAKPMNRIERHYDS